MSNLNALCHVIYDIHRSQGQGRGIFGGRRQLFCRHRHILGEESGDTEIPRENPSEQSQSHSTGAAQIPYQLKSVSRGKEDGRQLNSKTLPCKLLGRGTEPSLPSP